MDPPRSESPDSGYRSSSPRSPSSITKSIPLQTEKWQSISKKSSLSNVNVTYNSSPSDIQASEPRFDASRKLPQMSEHLLMITQSKTNEKITEKQVFQNSDGKTPNCCLSAVDTSERNKKRKIKENCQNGKQKKLVKVINMEEENSSPVLGIRILPFNEFEVASQCENQAKRSSRSKSPRTSKFEQFICKLCGEEHKDAVSLAQHKCARIINLRYDCKECGKTFGCPANLASHKRWHKPKDMDGKNDAKRSERYELENQPLAPFVRLKQQNSFAKLDEDKELELRQKLSSTHSKPKTGNRIFKAKFACQFCPRRFRRDSNRRKHAHVVHGIPNPPTARQQSQAAKKDFPNHRGVTINYHPYKEQAGTMQKNAFPYPCSSYNASTMIKHTPANDIKVLPNHQNAINICSSETQFSLSTLAAAAETLASAEIKRNKPMTIITAENASNYENSNIENGRENVSLDLTEPLDLSKKCNRNEKIRHSIEEITKPERTSDPCKKRQMSKNFSKSSSLCSVSHSDISERQMDPIPFSLLFRGLDGFQFAPIQQWPYQRVPSLQGFYFPEGLSDHSVAQQSYRR